MGKEVLEGQNCDPITKDDDDHKIYEAGKRRVSKKLADRVKSPEDGDLIKRELLTMYKSDPYSLDLKKIKASLGGLLSKFANFYEHENYYNLPRTYYEHVKKQIEIIPYTKPFDALVFIAKEWSLSQNVTLHALHLFHRTLAMCTLTRPSDCPGDKFINHLCIKLQYLTFACLVIAQKTYARRNSFTFPNIISWLEQSNGYTMEGLRRTELDILDGLKWSVTSPDINNYYEETVNSGILNQSQLDFFYALIEVGMFYPRCLLFRQREIAKAALFLVLTKFLKREDCLSIYELLSVGSPELAPCITTLAEKWNATGHSNLKLFCFHRHEFGRYGDLLLDFQSKLGMGTK